MEFFLLLTKCNQPKRNHKKTVFVFFFPVEGITVLLSLRLVVFFLNAAVVGTVAAFSLVFLLRRYSWTNASVFFVSAFSSLNPKKSLADVQ